MPALSPAQRFALALRPTLASSPLAPSAKRAADSVPEFLCWWLLFGRAEYPAVWHCTPAQLRAVMRPVAGAAPRLPRLLLRMHRARDDLARAFPLDQAEARAELLCWYRLYAAREFGIAPPLPAACRAVTEAARPPAPGAAGPPLPRILEALYRATPALQPLFDLRHPGARRALLHWFETAGHRLIPEPEDLSRRGMPRLPAGRVPRRGRRGGVNLVGFGSAEFGLGEDVRSLSRALEAAGVAHGIFSVTPPGVRARDGSRQELFDERLRYATTIFCVTAFDMAQLYLEHGPALFAGRRNIGYWPWEFAQFPPAWTEVFDLVGEVWAASGLQHAAFASVGACPVARLAPAVCLPAGARPRRRPRPGLVFRVIYPFDPNSFLARKNPLAAVRAFRRAFSRADRGARLTLRVNGRLPRDAAGRALRAAAAGDRRIRIVEGTLSRALALRDLARHDLLLSPHRAEGLGRNLAEAIALHVPVLATGGSGNADFMTAAELLPYRRARVAAGAYPYAAGFVWAEPLLAATAHRLRAARRKAARLRPTWFARRAACLLMVYGERAAGRRYRARLAGTDGSPDVPRLR